MIAKIEYVCPDSTIYRRITRAERPEINYNKLSGEVTIRVRCTECGQDHIINLTEAFRNE